LSQAEICRRMAGYLGQRPTGKDWDPRSVDRILRELLKDPPARRWNLQFLEAFAASIGAMPQRLVSPDFDSAKVSDATYAQYLSLALGKRLSPADSRRIVRNLSKELDRPGLFELINEIAEALIEAESREDAFFQVSDLVRTADLWDHKVRRGRKPAAPKRKRIARK
jgi:hypothetical protein